MRAKLTFLCALFCLMMAGCGKTGAEVRPFVQEDLHTLLQSGVFSEELEAVDAEIICKLYGLELGGDTVTACEGYLSGGATAEELVLFTAVDEKTAESVKVACEQRVDDQIIGFEDYIPGEVAKLKSAVIAVRGNTVLMIVANDGSAAASQVEQLS